MKLFNGKYQIPVLSPDDIAILKFELAELLFIKVFVVLWMGVTPDKRPNIDGL